MKKIIVMMQIVLLAIVLAACGSNPAGSAAQKSEASASASIAAATPQPTLKSNSASQAESSAPAGQSIPDSPASSSSAASESASPQSSASDAQEPESEAPLETEESKVLIAYFSRTGNTQQIAEAIQEYGGGELFKIETQRAYSSDYDTVLEEASKEQRENDRPELSGSVEDMDGYDTVFIGYPIWWSDTPMAVLTFLESYDLSGKTVIPFCTHGGGGSGRSFRSVEASADGATVLDGFSIVGSSVGQASDDIRQWLEQLGLQGV